ncbi:Probable RNA-directed DNA polymerase from transposon X-element [Eumeta japonica]|uniref:Probable RNA-directed DNA polymerase from transposon X-element n=1 Tax=Eumeta variegata TaxID=151549 RepID=A0A4C1WW49_EUMVA|nr:Probable RNA-directed DNA polymerase from transposon X-element [Eumeta japonica]
MNCILNCSLTVGPREGGRELGWSIRYGRESVYRTHVALMREICKVDTHKVVIRPLVYNEDAVIISIPKPRKPRDLPASYRPISIMSSLSKLYEKILKSRLSDHLIKKSLIIEEQFGFRHHHSCPGQALRRIEYILEGFKRKHKIVAVFFDVAEALIRWVLAFRSRIRPRRHRIIIFYRISNDLRAFNSGPGTLPDFDLDRARDSNPGSTLAFYPGPVVDFGPDSLFGPTLDSAPRTALIFDTANRYRSRFQFV